MNSAREYYLQVLKDGIAPKWPRPEEELELGAQKLSGGYTQHWAYVRSNESQPEAGQPLAENEVHESHDLPPAEKLAADYHSDKPAILIDQPQKVDDQKENFLELILVKDGHAWSKTESSLENLDDNLFDILDFARNQFSMEVEHFMTTNNVSAEVEKKMDEVEKEESKEPSTPADATADKDESQPKAGHPLDEKMEENVIIPSNMADKHVAQPIFNKPLAENMSQNSGFLAKFGAFLIPVIIIALIFAGTLLFKDQIFAKVKNVKQQGFSGVFSVATPTPTPSPPAVAGPTAVPTPSFAKADIQVRVLNGTTVTGAAKTLAEKLKGNGWAILVTGNNKNQAIPQTIVSGKEGKDDVTVAMAEDLRGDYEATVGANLKDTDKADIEIVIGKK